VAIVPKAGKLWPMPKGESAWIVNSSVRRLAKRDAVLLWGEYSNAEWIAAFSRVLASRRYCVPIDHDIFD